MSGTVYAVRVRQDTQLPVVHARVVEAMHGPNARLHMLQDAGQSMPFA